MSGRVLLGLTPDPVQPTAEQIGAYLRGGEGWA